MRIDRRINYKLFAPYLGKRLYKKNRKLLEPLKEPPEEYRGCKQYAVDFRKFWTDKTYIEKFSLPSLILRRWHETDTRFIILIYEEDGLIMGGRIIHNYRNYRCTILPEINKTTEAEYNICRRILDYLTLKRRTVMDFAPITYYTVFGAGDGSEEIGWEVKLTEEEAKIYNRAKKLLIPLEEVEGLDEALERAYKEIEKEEIENAIDYGDEYAIECMGAEEMDSDELNEMVREKNPKAIKYFELEDATDEDLEEWDANDLEELPTIAEFDPDFEPQSPFEIGWNLVVNFAEEGGYDDVEEEEALPVIEELFKEADGDYEELNGYLERLDEYLHSEKSAEELAEEVAKKLNITDFEEE